MTLFWLAAAALVALAFIFLLPPLLRNSARGAVTHASANLQVLRDQLRELDGDLSRGTISATQHAQAKQELEQRLIEEVGIDTVASAPVALPAKRMLAVLLALAIPVAAGAIYWLLGNPAALNPETRTGFTEADLAQRQKVMELTQKLEAKMRERPDDPLGWVMLGRAYKMTERYEESVTALARAAQLKPDDPDVQTEYAEAIMMVQSGRLDSAGEAALQRALRVDPANQRALALAGTAAYEGKQFAQAIKYWDQLLKLVPPETELAKSIEAGIAQARSDLSSSSSAKKAPQESVSGRVTLSAAIRDKVKPEDVVYIFARAAEGPRMPLAIQRVQVKDLPLNFSLDDSMSMSPQAKLSSASSVVVGARVSRSGNPMPQPGDLEGLSGVVKPGARDLSIAIDRVIK